MTPLWEMTKLERAQKIAEKFVDLQRASWQSTWPLGFCLNSSLLLAPLIRAPLEWRVLVAVGTVLGDRPHAWLETPDSDLIDPTFGQFTFEKPLLVLRREESERFRHKRAVLLTVDQENRYREAIKPSIGNGWDPGVEVHTLFGASPHVSPALSQSHANRPSVFGQSIHMG